MGALYKPKLYSTDINRDQEYQALYDGFITCYGWNSTGSQYGIIYKGENSGQLWEVGFCGYTAANAQNVAGSVPVKRGQYFQVGYGTFQSTRTQIFYWK